MGSGGTEVGFNQRKPELSLAELNAVAAEFSIEFYRRGSVCVQMVRSLEDDPDFRHIGEVLGDRLEDVGSRWVELVRHATRGGLVACLFLDRNPGKNFVLVD